ncbi:hypothetical protein WDW37_07785 [Bdellovibrionota bacterium FG-1]
MGFMRLVGLSAVFFLIPCAQAEHTRVTNPSAVSVEFFGRGLTYGLSFDRVVSDDLAAGVSLGRVSLNDLAGNDAGVSTMLIPVYANYYFTRDAGSFFATAGATLITNSGEAKGLKATLSGVEFTSSTPILAQVGVGYENRADAGYLFRVAAYGILGKTIVPWFGASLGYAF